MCNLGHIYANTSLANVLFLAYLPRIRSTSILVGGVTKERFVPNHAQQISGAGVRFNTLDIVPCAVARAAGIDWHV